MSFLTPVIASVLLVTTMGVGSYVETQAKNVVAKYNVVEISKVLEMHMVTDGKYPVGLQELVNGGELQNINVGDYKYQRLYDGQGAVLGVKDGSYCWKSEFYKTSECP